MLLGRVGEAFQAAVGSAEEADELAERRYILPNQTRRSEYGSSLVIRLADD